jgi:cell wall-associated NlpC family hydrolase
MTDGLLPGAAATGSIQADRELPLEARTWGRILDLSQLQPGDLLLTRPADPSTDAVSRGIIAAQERGGFHARHAQWTHAAVYLGDDEHVCEANFKFPAHLSASGDFEPADVPISWLEIT